MPAFQNVGLELSFNQKKNNITPSQKEMEIERINHNLNINCCILGLISDDNDCIFRCDSISTVEHVRPSVGPSPV